MLLRKACLLTILGLSLVKAYSLGDLRKRLTGHKDKDAAVNEIEIHSDVDNPDEQLLFAFELVRHGARAPFDDRMADKFTVGEGELTPEGMR